MWGTVFMVALFTAPNPVHLGIAVVLLSRPRPLLNLLAFWLGGMVVGFAGLGGLTLLRDSLPTVAQNVVSMVTGFTRGYRYAPAIRGPCHRAYRPHSPDCRPVPTMRWKAGVRG
jgi:Sap, sulfolipid-1-addressing protein